MASVKSQTQKPSNSTPIRTKAYSGWWGAIAYGDSDTDPGGPPELTVGTDNNSTNGHLDWGSYPGDPLVIDEDWTLAAPLNNNVSLSVMGTTITHATGGGVDIKKVSLNVGANPGLKVWLTDITATFSKSSGGSYSTPLATGPVADALNSNTNQTASSDITPPALQPPAYYSGVTVSGTLHMRNINSAVPDQNCYADIHAVR
jgi:hypothetical protein